MTITRGNVGTKSEAAEAPVFPGASCCFLAPGPLTYHTPPLDYTAMCRCHGACYV